jgi:3-oxoadipate enol-lactonase
MLSNSLLTDYGMWDFQVSTFTKHYRLLRYDTRGHGGTQSTSGRYSMDMLVADVIGLVDALDIAKFHFLGLSMGGMIAQLLASKHGDRLLSVSLCNTACHLGPAAMWDDRIRMAEDKGIGAFVQPMKERWLTQEYRDKNPEFLEKLGSIISKTSVAGFVGCAYALRDMDLLPILPNIKIPTLIVAGEQDIATPVSASEVLHQEIKGSRLVVIKQAGHLPNIEQTQSFDRTVLEFLGAH